MGSPKLFRDILMGEEELPSETDFLSFQQEEAAKHKHKGKQILHSPKPTLL